MEGCRVEIAKNLGKSVTFRALFVERDPERFSVLKRFADERSNNRIEVKAINEDFADSAQSVAQWIRDDEMAFVLIDPTGWKEVISPKTLARLLRKRNVEMLINVMWNFINLASAHANQEQSLEEIFGDQFKALLKAARMAGSGEPLMRGYLRRLKDFAGGQGSSTRLRTAWFPVEFPAAERVFYYLVYVTHHVKGMIVFLEESEKALQFQSKVKFVVKQQRREVSSGMDDLFGDELQLPNRTRGSTVHGARDAWIALFPEVNSELRVDEGRMADMAEECGCLISQLQESLRLLLDARVLQNVDAKRPRTKNHVNYHTGEVIRRLK